MDSRGLENKTDNPKIQINTLESKSDLVESILVTAQEMESTIHATHNLLWHLRIEESLDFFKKNPSCLNLTVSVKDIHGQLFTNKPVRILAAAGEFDPIEMKHQTHYGLVHRLRSCFKNQEDFETQLREQFAPGHKDVTRQRMMRYIKAIEIFIEEVIQCRDISYGVPFENLLDLPIVKKFRDALKPLPNDPVTLGLAWDLEILFIFTDIFAMNYWKLRGKWSIWSDVVESVVWCALQGRSSLCDLELLAKGYTYLDHGILPNRLDFSNGRPAILEGIGIDNFFGINGTKWRAGSSHDAWLESCRTSERIPEVVATLKTYVNRKHAYCEFYARSQVTAGINPVVSNQNKNTLQLSSTASISRLTTTSTRKEATVKADNGDAKARSILLTMEKNAEQKNAFSFHTQKNLPKIDPPENSANNPAQHFKLSCTLL